MWAANIILWMLAIEVWMSSDCVDTVCNLRLINVILCLDLESRISFVTHRHSAGDHSHQSPKLQCPLLRLSVLCCQGGMSISLISGLPAVPRLTAAHDSGKSDKENFVPLLHPTAQRPVPLSRLRAAPCSRLILLKQKLTKMQTCQGFKSFITVFCK